MTYPLDDNDAPRSRSWGSVIIILALAATGSFGALIWRGYAISLPKLSMSSPSANPLDKVATHKELQEFQQHVTGQIQGATQLLGSQQAEIGRLSEQLAALAIKIELLQRTAAPVQPPAPPIQKLVAPRVPLPQKKPAAAKPAEPLPDGSPAPPLQLGR